MPVIYISKEDLEECLDLELTQKQMAERFKVSVDTIRNFFKKYNLKFLGSKFHNRGENNPAKREEVKSRISQTVATLWENGCYANRIDGMIEKTGINHPNYKFHKWDYREYLAQYQCVDACSLCGNIESKIDIHHIDENHENWLVTNLEPLCVRCHQKFHLHIYKLPYVILGVKSSFAGAHNLINYNGKCSHKHGHEWKYEVKIKRRINPDTGMALDFKDIKYCLNTYINDVLDHSDLNEVLPFNPSAENIAVWIFETLSKKALLKGIYSITLWESDNSSLEITAKDMLEIEKKKEINKGSD